MPTNPFHSYVGFWSYHETFRTIQARRVSGRNDLTDDVETWDVEIWVWSEQANRKPQEFAILARLQDMPGVFLGITDGQPTHIEKSLGMARKDATRMSRVIACGKGVGCPGISKCGNCPWQLEP